MEKFTWLDVNITAFQLVDHRTDLVKTMVKDWMLNEFKGLKSPLENEKTFRVNLETKSFIQTETKFISIKVFSKF